MHHIINYATTSPLSSSSAPATTSYLLVFANLCNVLSAFQPLVHHIWLKATCAVEHLRCASTRSIPTEPTAVIFPPALSLNPFSPLSLYSHLHLPVGCHQTLLFAGAMSAPPGRRNAAPPAYRRLVSSVTSHVINSWDWKVRCAWQPLLWKRVILRGMPLVKALEQRLKLVETAPAFPFPCFDLEAARLPCKVDYATKPAAIGTELLKECGVADGRLFSLNQAFFQLQGFPSNITPKLDVIAPL